ncbi:MAG: AAA family ATPase [Bacillota bacterium]
MNSISLLEAMVAEQPTNARAWYLLGAEYARTGETSRALAAFARAMEHGDAALKAEVMKQLTQLTAPSSPPGAGAGSQEGPLPQPPAQAGPGPAVAARPGSGESAPHLRVVRGGADAAPPEPGPEPLTFADVGGLDELKQTIRMKIIEPFYNQGLFARFRKRAGGGILLYGPPGCGKTFIARATAGECRAHFLAVRISDVLDPYIGQSERNLRDLFDTARAKRPSVLFFDELDALAFQRSKAYSTYRPLIDMFLHELDGMGSDNDQVMVIGATNLPWDVDPAFKRPGRFDRMIFVPPPDEPARARIFQLKLAGRPAEGIEVAQLARETELFSGADIENAIEQATEQVLAEIMRTGQERPIRQEDLLRSVKALHPSTLEWLRTVQNYIRYANQTGQFDEVEAYLKRVKRHL